MICFVNGFLNMAIKNKITTQNVFDQCSIYALPSHSIKQTVTYQVIKDADKIITVNHTSPENLHM